MIYGKISGLDKQVSRIVFGCMNGKMNVGKNCDEALDEALAQGINTFDTARIYGSSERMLGNWLQRQDREKVVVLTKCAHPSFFKSFRVTPECIVTDFYRSLDELKTDYADILLLHKDNPRTDIPAVMETLHSLCEKKLVKAVGVSNWDYARIDAANAYATQHSLTPLTVSSPHFGLAVQNGAPWKGCISVTADSEEQQRYRQSGMPLFAFFSLARGLMGGKYRHDDKRLISSLDAPAKKGFLTDDNLKRLARAEILADKLGCTVAQISLAWMFTRGMNVFAVLSQSSPERVRQNAASVNVQLTPAQSDWLNLERETCD